MTQLYPIPATAYTGKYLSGHRPGEQFCAELLRYALGNLRKLASDPTDQTLPQLLSFYPANADKKQPDPSPSIQMFRTWLAKNTISVRDAFPKHDYPVPFVAVWPLDEREKPEQPLGDLMLTHSEGGANGVLYQQQLLGQFVSQQLRFMITTDDPQTTMFLYRVVWYIIFINKLDLISYVDFHNLTMSGGQLDFDQNIYPNWQYTRQITISYDTIFDFYTGAERVPKAVSLTAGAAEAEDATVTVEVASST